MKLKNTSVCLLAGWMLMACSGGGYEKTSNGIIVNVEQQQPTDVRKVKVDSCVSHSRKKLFKGGKPDHSSPKR